MNKIIITLFCLLILNGPVVAHEGGWDIRKNYGLIEVLYDPFALPYHIPFPDSIVNRLNSLRSKGSRYSGFEIEFLGSGDKYAKERGDKAVDWPEDAKNVFLYVADLWSALLDIKIPVTVKAVWAGNMDAGVLGHSAPISIVSTDKCQFPVALLNQIEEKDLDSNDADIYCAFNASFKWYKGTDGNTPGGQSDLVSVIMHEFCHGLGFIGSMSVDGDIGSWGFGTKLPFVYDLFTVDENGGKLIDEQIYLNPSRVLFQRLTSGEVYFVGVNAMAANKNMPVALYTPRIWSPGSSYSHLGEQFINTPDALMCYALGPGQSIHYPGKVTLGILRDEGWSMNESANILPPPIALEGTNITSSSFLAHWEEVKEADTYRLKLYKLGPAPPPEAKDQERKASIIRIIDDLIGDSFLVEGLDGASDYQYTIEALNGQFSVPSNLISVSTLSITSFEVIDKDDFARVYGYDGVICIDINKAGEYTILIYSLDGYLLRQKKVKMGVTKIQMPVRGLYLVKIEERMYKVML